MALNFGNDGTHYTSETFGKLYTNQTYDYTAGITKSICADDFLALKRTNIITSNTVNAEEADDSTLSISAHIEC